ncbi:MAG: STAS domain-containing protein [Pseudomonadota bacterium]
MLGEHAEATIDIDASGRVRVSGPVVMDSVVMLERELTSALAKAPGATIDFSGVTRADSAGVALLIASMRESNARGEQVAFENLPSQMIDIARVCGLDWIPGVAPE